jgi:hypothetical protein
MAMSFNHHKGSLFRVAPSSSSTTDVISNIARPSDARESKQAPQRIPAIIPFISKKVETHDTRR